MKASGWMTLGVGAGLLYWLAKRQPLTMSGLDDLTDLGKKRPTATRRRTVKGRGTEEEKRAISDALDLLVGGALALIIPAWKPDDAAGIQITDREGDIKPGRKAAEYAKSLWWMKTVAPLLESRYRAGVALGLTDKAPTTLYWLPFSPDPVSFSQQAKTVWPLHAVSENQSGGTLDSGQQYHNIKEFRRLLVLHMATAALEKIGAQYKGDGADVSALALALEAAAKTGAMSPARVDPQIMRLAPVQKLQKSVQRVMETAAIAARLADAESELDYLLGPKNARGKRQGGKIEPMEEELKKAIAERNEEFERSLRLRIRAARAKIERAQDIIKNKGRPVSATVGKRKGVFAAAVPMPTLPEYRPPEAASAGSLSPEELSRRTEIVRLHERYKVLDDACRSRVPQIQVYGLEREMAAIIARLQNIGDTSAQFVYAPVCQPAMASSAGLIIPTGPSWIPTGPSWESPMEELGPLPPITQPPSPGSGLETLYSGGGVTGLEFPALPRKKPPLKIELPELKP